MTYGSETLFQNVAFRKMKGNVPSGTLTKGQIR